MVRASNGDGHKLTCACSGAGHRDQRRVKSGCGFGGPLFERRSLQPLQVLGPVEHAVERLAPEAHLAPLHPATGAGRLQVHEIESGSDDDGSGSGIP